MKMKSNLEELKALRKPQPDNQSKSQSSPADNRPFKEPESQRSLNLGIHTDAMQLDQNLDQAFQQIMDGLNAADLQWVAQTIIDEVNNATDRASKLSEVIEHFRNPETTIKMAYVLAGKKIAERQTVQIPRPAFNIVLPGLPSLSVPDFARFYRSADLSQAQIGEAKNPAQTTNDSPTTSTSSDKNENA